MTISIANKINLFVPAVSNRRFIRWSGWSGGNRVSESPEMVKISGSESESDSYTLCDQKDQQ